MAYSKTTWNNNTTPAINADNLNKIENGIKDATDKVESAERDLGQWYFETSYVSYQFPRIQFENNNYSKLFFRLIAPTTGVKGFLINGSNDGWQTQTQIFISDEVEYNGEVDTTGYASLRVALRLNSASTGTYKAIIHFYDGHSVSEELIKVEGTLNDTIASFNELKVPDEKLTGTNYNKFYLNSNPYQGIRSINNTVFNLRAYTVLAGHTYYLFGKGVALHAALPVAAFGTEAVVDYNNYKEKILDGYTTPTDYAKSYTPKENGYIYVAWVTNKVELGLYDTELVSNAFIDKYGANEKQNISIQLFGDSITDNLWGDETTWVNFIDENLSDYNVTIYNEAVGGSGIGHGKSETTPSHQADTYNYVHDLVTDGVTLKSDVDFIVILVGTNDWSSGKDIGDMSSTNVGYLYGALKGIMEYISEHSTALTFICTIPQRYNTTDQGRDTNVYGEPLNADGVSLAEFCEPYKKVSAFFGFPCIDLNSSLGFNRLNIGDFTTDGLHPNAKGDKLIAAFICDEIRKRINKAN